MSDLWSQRRALALSVCIISAATETLEAALCLSKTRWPPCTPLYSIKAVCLLSDLLYLWHAAC